MTNETIKENLKNLYDCKIDFSVTMTGKKSNKVNGLYRPATKEIFLHNKNFNSENELMYTAIHEFTHHVITTEKNVKTAKCHSGVFWATFHDFLDKAIQLKIYERNRSEETKKLIETAKQLQQEIIEAQKKLGEIIAKLNETCTENGERFEDVITHDLQITTNRAKDFWKMQKDSSSNNEEISKAVNSAKDLMTKQAAQDAADNGATVEQVKAIAKKKAKAVDDDLESIEQLTREEKRLEKTIDRLNDRLVQVQETLRSMRG